jgi:hypothetical protein
MTWHHVDDALPRCPRDHRGEYLPTMVFIYAATIDRHGIAWYAPRRRPAPWAFLLNTTEDLRTDHDSRRTFREGRLITHWAAPTRPRRAAAHTTKGGAS